MALGRIEAFARRGDIELVNVLPEGKRSDGTFVDVTVSILTSDGVQYDFPLTPKELRNKGRLRRLARLLRRKGVLLLDTYELLGPAPPVGTPSLPGR